MRRFVIGDIHGGHKALVQCLKRSNHACNVWDLDTGGGWGGKLTIMDIDSHEYWQSDLVPDLYPHIQGRRAAKARDAYF